MSAKPLWQACREANPGLVEKLLRQGADPNAPWRGYPPLHIPKSQPAWKTC